MAVTDGYRKVAVRAREEQSRSAKKSRSRVRDMGQEERSVVVQGEAGGENGGEGIEEAGEEEGGGGKGKGRRGSSVP